MNKKIRITPKGVKSALKKYQFSQSIAEYVWNGFDAQATKVEINYDSNEIGFISSINIKDNGYGIPSTKLKDKFEPFFESEKMYEYGSEKNSSTMHGKNGVGRLTFFTFSTKVVWNTSYIDDEKLFNYDIEVNADNIDKYSGGDIKTLNRISQHTGTTATFTGLHGIEESNMLELKDFLLNEFGWFLELNLEKKYEILINGERLDHTQIIGDQESIKIVHKETGTEFNVKYIRWNQKLNTEYSKYYYLDSDKTEKWKEYTTLNNKGDHFYHSLYITSDYFDLFNFSANTVTNQMSLAGGTRNEDQFKYLQNQLQKYLIKKRKPFLLNYSAKLIAEYEKESIFPIFSDSLWDRVRLDELKEVTSLLYVTQPKIFNSFNLEQKRAFIGMLNLILDSNERENLLSIIQAVVDLDTDERIKLADALHVTSLSKIVQTIKLIEDRYKTIGLLKELIFNKEWSANEVENIQKSVENHFWIFGEQYNLVSAAEPRFNKALSKHHYLLTGEDKTYDINHPDKNKEMDIFMCRQNKNLDTIDNIIVELKSPTIHLGEKEVAQVKKYLSVITSQEELNAENMNWTFYLVGNKFDNSEYIDREIENKKTSGENSLIFSGKNYKIYVKRWSEIFTEFDCKHEFINQKLQLQRDLLLPLMKDKDQIQESINTNSASMLAT